MLLAELCIYLNFRFSDIDINNISPEWISPSSDRDFRSIMAYNRSKICSMLFSHELNNQLWDQGVVSNSVHPGNLIYTGLGKDSKLYRSVLFLFRPFSKSLVSGCFSKISWNTLCRGDCLESRSTLKYFSGRILVDTSDHTRYIYLTSFWRFYLKIPYVPLWTTSLLS